jgi:uncharacterized membrane protein YbhN (UPF0104 family)
MIDPVSPQEAIANHSPCVTTPERGAVDRPGLACRWGLLFQMLRYLVGVGILGWLVWRTDWSRLGQAFAQLRLVLWLEAVGLCVVMQVLSGFRWQLLAQPLGFQGSLRRFAGFYFIGMYFNLVLPTSVGGDVVRACYLDGRTGRRVAAFLTVLVDRVSGLLILLLVACVAVGVCPIPLVPWVEQSVWGMAGAAAAGCLVLPLLARWTVRFDLSRRLMQGVRFYFQHPRLLLGTTGLSVVVQAANVLLVWLIGQAIGAPVPAIYYWIFVPMVSLLTLLPVSINGMGIREGCTVLFLAPLGVSEGTALCLALLWFSVLTVVSLSGGGVYLLGRFARPGLQPQAA